MAKIIVAFSIDDRTALVLERTIKLSGLSKSEYWRRLITGMIEGDAGTRDASRKVSTDAVFKGGYDTQPGNPLWETGCFAPDAGASSEEPREAGGDDAAGDDEAGDTESAADVEAEPERETVAA